MHRYLLLLLAFIGIGAVSVSSLPSFNLSTDTNKALTIGSRGLTYTHGTNDELSVLDYGADPTGVSDSLAAFNAALAAADTISGALAPGYAIHVPKGTYRFTDTLHKANQARMYGDGRTATVLRFPPAYTGIVVEYYLTGPTGNTGNASGTVLEHMGLEPTGNATAWQAAHAYTVGQRVRSTTNIKDGLVFRCTVAGTSHASVEPTMPAYNATVVDNGVTWKADYAAGIWLRAPAALNDVQIGVVTGAAGFAGHGLQVIASTSDSPASNANGWTANNVRVSTSRADGVRASGADANRGEFANSTVDANGGWGVNDASFLGNTWRNLISQSNGSGGYKCTGDSATSVFYDCYSESDEPASTVEFPAAVVGGLFAGTGGVSANGFTSGSNAARMINGIFAGKVTVFNGNSTDGYVETEFSPNGNDGDILTHWSGYNTSKALISGTDLRLKYWHAGGYFRFDLSNSDSLIGAMVHTTNASPTSTYLNGMWVFPLGIALNNAADNVGSGLVLTADDAAPTSGAHGAGELVLNKGPSGPVAWKCITAGTPGTWLSVLGGPSSTVAAAGTNQGNATALTTAYDHWRVTGHDAVKGVVLPTGPTGTCLQIYTVGDGNGELLVYPGSGDTIEGGAANAAMAQEDNKSIRWCLQSDAVNWTRD